MAKLIENVLVGRRWYGPSYPDAGDPPKGKVTNPMAWDDPPSYCDDPSIDPYDDGDDDEADEDDDESDPAAAPNQPPPKAGPGSSDAAWTSYARSRGVQVTDDMNRKQVIDACTAAGVPTTRT